MKLPINQVLKTLDGEPIGEKDKKFTVKNAIIESLLATYQDEKEVSQAVKMERWVLAKKIHNSKDVIDLTIEEASTIKTLVFKGYGTLIAGQVADLLESNG